MKALEKVMWSEIPMGGLDDKPEPMGALDYGQTPCMLLSCQTEGGGGWGGCSNQAAGVSPSGAPCRASGL